MKRKILFVVPSLMMGGAERQLTILIQGIASELYEPHVAIFNAGGEFWEILKRDPRCYLYNLERKSRWDFSIIWKLARYIKSNQIDLLQGWMPPANTFAALAGMISRRPIVFGIRASNAQYPTLGGKFYVYTDGILSKFANALVCNSANGAEYHRNIGYDKKKMKIIPNCIETPEGVLFPEAFQHCSPWNIGMLARFDPMKDHANMFYALKIILDTECEVILHLFGDGPKEITNKLKALASDLGIKKNIIWHGRTNNWQALSKIDLLVSSSYGEGMSNAILEAMAAGRPIVATNVGDSKNLVCGNGRACGIIVPPKDSNALANAIIELISNKELANDYAVNGKTHVKEHFSTSQMIQKYVSLYRSVLGERL